MAKRRDKIVIGGGKGWHWWRYIVDSKVICSTETTMPHGDALRSASQFAAKFIDPPPIVDQKE